uniref:MULE transposase domain-containing protein n=1 Tax=Fagus sylvatica TaxID=28930 RepID=A0A2N9H8U3_FAGSY
MGNRSPVTIFTDQDQAMSNAIEKMFLDAHRWLCLWYIAKNAPSHLGELNANSEFKYLFNKCQKYCDSEIEFQETWDKMMQKFNLGNHRWLNMMYKIRHKWSIAFTKDSFTAEFKASLRSESTNHVLNGIASKTTGLTKFVIENDNLVTLMFSSEFDEDFRCKQGAPPRVVKEEWYFGSCCSSLHLIPSQYILKRWTKDAKKGMMAYEHDNHSLDTDKDAEIVWRNSIRIANTTIYKSQGEDSLKTICQKMLLELDEKIERELSRLKLGTVAGEDEVVQCNTTDDMPVSDPPQARSKGVRNTRIRGHFEKRKTKPSKDASSLRKAKQQVTKGHSNDSFAGTYDAPIIQPPNPSCHIGSTSANLYGQSYSPWTMPSQDMSCINIPFTTMLEGTDVIAQISQNSSTYIPSQYISLINNSKQSDSTYGQEKEDVMLPSI